MRKKCLLLMSALFFLCSAYSWGQLNNYGLDSLKQFRSDPPVPKSKSVELRAAYNHTDLGDGFFLLDTSIDANSSVVGLKINSAQLAALTAGTTFDTELEGITKTCMALNGNGLRTPDASASQKQFKLLTVVLTNETVVQR